jgi:GT2 family glycosyltransferase/Flp pilus assembly protein TadD/glycosyltransferase involved in cell wall biosynthesis
MSETPVILITYNRPAHTEKVLRALKEHDVQNLFIFSDGPKFEEDLTNLYETRVLFQKIDWTNPTIIEQDKNFGLATSIIFAVNLVFQKFNKMILLEDDCVPQKYFFDFIETCLNKYSGCENVFGISGYTVPITDSILKNYPYDLYFFPRIGSWGWATWKRRWAHFESDLLKAYQKALNDNIDFEQGGNDIPHLLGQIIGGQLKDVWTLNWLISVYLNKGYYIYPTLSHIDNIGMDGSGVHCNKTNKFVPRVADFKPTRYPEDIIINKKIFQNFRKFYDIPRNQQTPKKAHRKLRKYTKIVHICTHDFGGAGKAAYRLHKGLQPISVASTMLVVNKKSGDPSVKVFPVQYLGSMTQGLNISYHESPLWLQQMHRWETELAKYPNRPAGLEIFSGELSNIQLEQIQEIKDADIINLHWVAGTLDYITAPLALKDKQIVWTLHDMNPFTGGCHYSGTCEKYKERCGACPQLGSTIEDDLSRKIWNKKHYAFQNLDINIVTPSKWLAKCATQSSLLSGFSVTVIPNGFPLDIFKPYPKTEIRKALSIPVSARVILFGADSIVNSRKGFVYLLEALKGLPSIKENVTVVLTFGNLPKGIKINTKHTIHSLGSITDENKLALVYSAADVFVIPSLEDNLPNTVVEAMACGVPVVGFEVGGIPDMIDHKKNGYLAKPKDIDDLLEGIKWALFSADGDTNISALCREKAGKKFALEAQANAYKELYDLIMSNQLLKSEEKSIKQRKPKDSFQLQTRNTELEKSVADNYHKIGRLKQALELYIDLSKKNPADLNALLALGILSTKLKRFDEAFVFYKKALEVSPRSADVRDVFLQLGKQIIISGDLDRARECYLYYLIRNAGDEQIRQAWENLKDTKTDKHIIKKVKAKNNDYIVSAIVSTYNSEEFIGECLENLESQSINKNIEIVVVDAASPQNEEKIVNQFQKRYSNITYIKTRNRISVYAAWNIAIKKASGRYCITASTNDSLSKDACEILARYLDENPKCMLVYGDTYLTKTPHQSFENNTHTGTYRWPAYSFQDHLHNCLVGPHPMWRKKVHLDIGFFDENYITVGDQEFWLRIGEKFNIAHISEFTGLQWITDDAISRKGLLPHLEILNIQSTYKKRFLIDNKSKRALCSIIIPVFNQINFTKQCIEALYRNTPDSLFELIIVDNNSTDGTGDYLAGISEKAKVITNKENLGFAKACNQGASQASGKYLLFLNNDTEVQPGWLNALVEVLDQDNSVAAVGSKMLFPDKKIQHAGVVIVDDQKLPDPLVARHIYYQQAHNYPQADKMSTYQALTAACILVRKSAFDAVDGFDEQYWNGYEDIDLCFKFQKKGWQLIYQPKSVVIHYESQSGPERFRRVQHNIDRLHQKWLGKIKPDLIIKSNGATVETGAGHIRPYQMKTSPIQQITGSRVSIKKLTSIIILTYNQIEYTKKCIDSIFKNTSEPFELIVVDNGSSDGTVKYLESEVLGRNTAVRLKLIKNKENKGFAGGNNQGIAAATGGYILLLNNDVVVTSGWLEILVNCAERSSKIGIVGPRSNYVSGPQLVKEVSYNTTNLEGLSEYASKFADTYSGQVQRVLRVVGFCMLIKRLVIEKIGGLDDRYGLGNFEDDDLSLRAAIAGFESWIAKDCFIHHFGSRTFIGANIDFRKSLHNNWEIFKKKWGLPEDLPYGSAYSISQMSIKGFNPEKHYIPLPKPEDYAAQMLQNGFHDPARMYHELLSKFGNCSSEEALKDLQNFAFSYPEFGPAHNDLGVLFYDHGHKEKAFYHYEKAVQLEPENTVFQKNLADFYYVEMGRVEEALEIYVRILKTDPQDVEALMATGQICKAFEKPDDASYFFNRILEIDPQNADACKQLEELSRPSHGASLNSESAEDAYRRLQERLDTLSPPEAIAEFEKLVEFYPDFAVGHNDLGVLYYNTGDKEKALRHYQQAAHLQPENMTLQKNLADFLYVECGQVEEALQIYVNVLAAHPEDVETLLITGHICVALKRFEDASDFYKRVLEIEPGNEEATKTLAALENYQRQSKTQMAHSSDIFQDANNADKPEISDQTEVGPSKDEDHELTVSIIISLDGIQNRLRDCLASIQQYTSEPHEIMFIDNGATKGMQKWAQRMVSDHPNYRILKVEKKIGWPAGVNRGFSAACGEVVAILQNDVVVSEGWLAGMLDCLHRDCRIALVGPMTTNSDGIQKDIHVNCRSMDDFDAASKKFRKLNRHRRVPVAYLAAGCFLFKRELVEDIGQFDEGLSTEEMAVKEFCFRANYHGYQNFIAGDVLMYQSNKVPPKTSPARLRDHKAFKEKLNALEMQNPAGRQLQILRILELADQLNQRGLVDKAVEKLLLGIGILSADPRCYLALAKLLIKAKRFQGALDALKQMPNLDRSEISFPGNGGLGNEDNADLNLRRATLVRDQKIRQLELYGYCEQSLENFNRAENYADRVLALNPSSAPVLNLKGILAYQQKDKNSAVAYFNKALESDPGFGEAYTNLGTIQWEEGQVREALENYERGFILYPTDFDVATIYHSAVTALGEFQRARSCVQAAAGLHPHNKKIRYMLIDIFIQQGNFSEAINAIEEAVAKFGIADGILDAALKIRDQLGPIQIKKLSKKPAVSLCMIVKNEEPYLAKCLASVKPVVDEMIVIDTGSTDRTKDIAKIFGAQVFDFEWGEDFSQARNFSISKASGDWIFIMDGDEVLSSLDYETFKNIVQKSPRSVVAYSIVTRNYCALANSFGWVPNDGKYEKEEASLGWIPSVKVRLFHGKDRILFEGAVHEMVEPVLKRIGIPIKACPIPIHHYGRLNKEKLERKGEKYFEIGKKKLEAMGHDLGALRELAVQAAVLGKNEEGIALWQRFLSLDPSPALASEAFVNLGTIYSRLGKHEDALQASKRASELTPDMKEARNNFALAKFYLGYVEEAIPVFEKLLKQFPEYLSALFKLAAAYCCNGQKEKGRQTFEILRQGAKMGRTEMAAACHDLARGLISAHQIHYAVGLLNAAIENNYINEDLLNLHAEYLNKRDGVSSANDIVGQSMRIEDVQENNAQPAV